MHLLGNCVMILGLAALAIIGFLRVVKDLLSKNIFEAPSSSNEEWALETPEDAMLSSAGCAPVEIPEIEQQS
jgi:hypothetical protein